MTIARNRLHAAALTYLAMPTMVFFFGMVRASVAIPCALAVMVCVGLACRRHDSSLHKEENHDIEISLWGLFAAVAIIVTWCLFGGQGGFDVICQTGDWKYRNAVFRDLLTSPWPVVYQNLDGALCYYVGHWLVPALPAKLVLALGGTWESVWRVGNLALLTWTVLGMLIAVLLLASCGTQCNVAGVLFATFTFVFFGGMDMIGKGIVLWANGNIANMDVLARVETWAAPEFEFSSPTTLLFWAFNQAVPAFVATLLAWSERTIRNWAVIIAALIICAPFPVVGLAFCMAIVAMCRFTVSCRTGQARKFLTDVFSLQNMLAVCVVAPVPISYLFANSRSSSAVLCDGWNSGVVLLYALFLLLEVGIYAGLLWKERKNDVWFYAMIVSLVIMPMITIGVKRVFGMRATIPALTLLLLFVYRGMMGETHQFMRHMLLIAVFAIGMLTPTLEMVSLVQKTKAVWPNVTPCDTIVTFDQPYRDCIWKNFWALQPQESLFFRVFAKQTSMPRK